MKKTIAVMFAVMMMFSTYALCEDDLLAAIQAKGTLTYGTEGEWSPWTYFDENNNLVGFDVEVAAAVCDKLGIAPDPRPTPWDGIFMSIDNKTYDTAANGVEVTAERTQKYDFSEPYAYARTVLVVRGDNDTITCFEDLAGKTTANSLGSTYEIIAEDYGATCTAVDTLEDTMEMVISGRSDATLNAEVSVYEFLSVKPDANIKVVAVSEDANCIAFPVRKGDASAAFLEAVNNAISELRADGTLSAISEKYFGIDITTQS